MNTRRLRDNKAISNGITVLVAIVILIIAFGAYLGLLGLALADCLRQFDATNREPSGVWIFLQPDRKSS